MEPFFVPAIFREVASHLIVKRDHLVSVVRRRMSCEQWIHVETFFVLENMMKNGAIDAYHPETQYMKGRRERCDLTVQKGGESAWIEFEAVVTNYGQSGKPITNQVDHAIDDARRLVALTGGRKGWLFCLVYPLPADGSNDSDWSKHLDRAQAEGRFYSVAEQGIPVDETWSARLYLFETREI